MREIIGRKIGMTQVFANDGKMYPVTVVEVLPNVVTQVKTLEKDGYLSLQVGYEEQKESRLNKPERGIYQKTGVAPKMHLREIQGDELMGYQVGDELTAEKLFKTGDVVDVIGVSKGKGFTGVIKQYHFKIGPKGHGSGYHRGVGSMAVNGLGVNRVMPGKKMPGHRGNQQVTILNLIIVDILAEKNAVLIKGAIPGPKYSLVKIRSAVKAQTGTVEKIHELVDRSIKEEIVPEVEVQEEVVVEPVVEEAVVPQEEVQVEQVVEETPVTDDAAEVVAEVIEEKEGE